MKSPSPVPLPISLVVKNDSNARFATCGLFPTPVSRTQISTFVSSLDVAPLTLIVYIVLFYLVLGCFLDALAMMITTIPILFPVILHIGYDPIWFGVFVGIMCELALLTPPVGMNLRFKNDSLNRLAIKSRASLGNCC